MGGGGPGRTGEDMEGTARRGRVSEWGETVLVKGGEDLRDRQDVEMVLGLRVDGDVPAMRVIPHFVPL